MHKGAGLGADIYLIIYRRRRIRFAIRWWSRLGENGILCCLFLHQTTTRRRNRTIRLSCMSFVSYIKPQLLYIIAFIVVCCISSVSYIKPQPNPGSTIKEQRCISFVSYIKPQPIITNKLYTNMLLIFFIIKNGRVGFVSIAKILKKLQLNRFADDFFCDFA